MRTLLLIILSCAAPASLVAAQQGNEQARQAEQVKAAVARLPAKKARLRVTLRDLSNFEGVAAPPDEDSFPLIVRDVRGVHHEVVIKYRDVLELKGKGVTVGFVPDPMARPYGSWGDVRALAFGDPVEVVLDGGRKVRARISNTAETGVTLLAPDGRETVHGRDSVLRVFRVRDKSAGASAMGGGIRGKQIGEVFNGPGKAIGTGIGSGVGALVGALQKNGKRRVLVYAK